MDYLDTRWTKLKDYDFGDEDSTTSETKKFLNSDDNNSPNSSDEEEEWVQQLKRDYGKKSSSNRGRTLFAQKWRLTKCTRLEKYLALGLSVSLLVAVLLTTVVVVRYFSMRGEVELSTYVLSSGQSLETLRSTCISKGCVDASHHVNAYLDESAEPCEDFYAFSCGTWLRDAQIPSGVSHLTSFSELAERNQLKLKRILDRLHPLKNDSEAVRKVHMFYKACRDSDWMEKNALGSVKTLIGQVGNWGLWNSSIWNDEDWSFEQALNKIHKLKNMPLFHMFVASDDIRSNENSIQIEQSGITLPDEEFYTRKDDDKVIRAYKKLMVDVGKLLGGENVENQMREVFEFEKKLASIYESKETLRKADQIHNKMTVEQLQDLCPAIPWLDFMNSMFNTKVTFDEPVVVYTPHYLKNMSDLVIRTERRILANYMVWHLIKPLVPMLSKPFRDAYSGLLRAEKGLDIVDPSWRSCVKQTDSVLGFATGYLFIRDSKKQNAASIKQQIKDMVTAVKESFVLEISSKQWMDTETRLKAIEKVSLLIDMIGFPDWLVDPRALENYYKNLSVTANPFKNYLNARLFYHQKTMNRRSTKPDRTEWHVTPTAVNAFYNSPRNYIAFPSGILQSPFFNPEYPASMNYGSLGTILAHELTHGFDDKGRLFDGQGNMKNWWSKESKSEFERLAKCFEEQYSNFTTKKTKINSKQTLSENIADNGGLKLAFKAYKSLAIDNNNNNIQETLPAVQLTADQLFFVSFAQIWCSTSTASSAEESLIIDRHSPDRIRVLAAISNSEEFSKAFNCPASSKMNPSKKCELW
eukprot:gene6516-7260_t